MQTMPWVSRATVWASANRSSGPAALARVEHARGERLQALPAHVRRYGEQRDARLDGGLPQRCPSSARPAIRRGAWHCELHRDRRRPGGARRPHERHRVTAAGAHDEDEAAAVLVGLVVGIDDGQAADRHVEARGRGHHRDQRLADGREELAQRAHHVVPSDDSDGSTLADRTSPRRASTAYRSPHAEVHVAGRGPVAPGAGDRRVGPVRPAREPLRGGRHRRRRPRHRPRADGRPARHPRPPRRGHHRAGAGRRQRRGLRAHPRAAGRRGPRRPGRGVGEALGARAEPRQRRRQDRPGRAPAACARRPRPSAPRSPSTWRTTPPPTAPWRPCASCGSTTRGSAPWCRRTCAAPRRTAATSPGRARGCGCARAPTTSPRRWPTATGPTSTRPSRAA